MKCPADVRRWYDLVARLILALGLCLNAGGCQQKENPTGPPTDDAGSEEAPIDDAARARAEATQNLAALGYIDYSPEEADPDRMGVVRRDPQRSHPGYNLYCNPRLASAFLIDETGKVIQSWSHAESDRWANAELLPNGDLLVPDSNPKHLLRMSWDGRLIWKREVVAHHDVEVTPRDRILTLAYEFVQRPIDPLQIRDTPLVLLTHDGSVIEKVSLYDVLSTRPDLLKLKVAGIKTVRARGETGLDLLHANSIEWMHHKHLESRDAIYAAGNVIISLRHQNAVVIIDWEARKLLWAWGPGEILGPHDATVLESGNILLFDNGRQRRWSRVVELDPLTRKIVWEYKARTPTDFYTRARGGSQRLGNGNTLITNSNSGQVFEVTPKGEVVWEFLSPQLNEKGHRATIVRMKRYERAFVERILERHLPADGSGSP